MSDSLAPSSDPDIPTPSRSDLLPHVHGSVRDQLAACSLDAKHAENEWMGARRTWDEQHKQAAERRRASARQSEVAEELERKSKERDHTVLDATRSTLWDEAETLWYAGAADDAKRVAQLAESMGKPNRPADPSNPVDSGEQSSGNGPPEKADKDTSESVDPESSYPPSPPGSGRALPPQDHKTTEEILELMRKPFAPPVPDPEARGNPYLVEHSERQKERRKADEEDRMEREKRSAQIWYGPLNPAPPDWAEINASAMREFAMEDNRRRENDEEDRRSAIEQPKPWHKRSDLVIAILLALGAGVLSIAALILPPTSTKGILFWLAAMFIMLIGSWLLVSLIPLLLVVVFGSYSWPEAVPVKSQLPDINATQNYRTAVEMMQSSDTLIRVAGIHRLGQFMQGSDFWEVSELFVVHLRRMINKDKAKNTLTREPNEINILMNVLGRNNTAQKHKYQDRLIRQIPLWELDFTGLYLSDVNFDECNFVNSNFTNAQLDRVSLEGSDFENAIFTGARLTNCRRVNEKNRSLQDALTKAGVKCNSFAED